MCIDQDQGAMASRGFGLPTLVATKVIASTTLRLLPERLLPERHMSASSRDMIGGAFEPAAGPGAWNAQMRVRSTEDGRFQFVAEDIVVDDPRDFGSACQAVAGDFAHCPAAIARRTRSAIDRAFNFFMTAARWVSTVR